MEVTFECKKEQTVKEMVYEKISRNFYGYLKSHNVKYTLNGQEIPSHQAINPGDLITITYDDGEGKVGLFSDKALCVVYEDSNFIVVDKEAHVQTIPSTKDPYDSIYNRLMSYFKETYNTIHIVNRLDKETKGLILVAKNKIARAMLSDWDKTYYATTSVKLPETNGVFMDCIKKSDDGIKREVSKDGEFACTLYELASEDEKNSRYTYKISLRTGKTHQIRVHFAYHGAPLVGDTLYGGEEAPEMMLTCRYLSFTNPLTRQTIYLQSRY